MAASARPTSTSPTFSPLNLAIESAALAGGGDEKTLYPQFRAAFKEEGSSVLSYAALNKPDSDGKTPVERAVSGACPLALKWLMDITQHPDIPRTFRDSLSGEVNLDFSKLLLMAVKNFTSEEFKQDTTNTTNKSKDSEKKEIITLLLEAYKNRLKYLSTMPPRPTNAIHAASMANVLFFFDEWARLSLFELTEFLMDKKYQPTVMYVFNLNRSKTVDFTTLSFIDISQGITETILQYTISCINHWISSHHHISSKICNNFYNKLNDILLYVINPKNQNKPRAIKIRELISNNTNLTKQLFWSIFPEEIHSREKQLIYLLDTNLSLIPAPINIEYRFAKDEDFENTYWERSIILAQMLVRNNRSVIDYSFFTNKNQSCIIENLLTKKAELNEVDLQLLAQLRMSPLNWPTIDSKTEQISKKYIQFFEYIYAQKEMFTHQWPVHWSYKIFFEMAVAQHKQEKQFIKEILSRSPYVLVPLTISAYLGEEAEVERLLKSGANIHQKSRCLAIQAAVAGGHVAIVRMFIRHGAADELTEADFQETNWQHLPLKQWNTNSEANILQARNFALSHIRPAPSAPPRESQPNAAAASAADNNAAGGAAAALPSEHLSKIMADAISPGGPAMFAAPAVAATASSEQEGVPNTPINYISAEIDSYAAKLPDPTAVVNLRRLQTELSKLMEKINPVLLSHPSHEEGAAAGPKPC